MARQISAALRPPLLDDLGLAAALAHHAKGLERQGQLKVALDVRDEERLSAEQRNQLFRILQEAATNVLRHAQARRVSVELDVSAGFASLRINDDGRGGIGQHGNGLTGMAERLQARGGRLLVESPAAGGSRLQLLLPLNTPIDREAAP